MSRRSSLPESLRSAEIKLRRANLHKGIARREAVRFFKRHPAPTFRIEPEGDQEPSGVIDSINRCRIVLERGLPDLPDSFAARFGDAIHNYRCVLDHIAWQLVVHGASWPLSENERTSVQFPIYSAERGFDSSRPRRLPGVPDPAVSFIKARHNYVGGNATNNALLAIAALSNDDKHRALHVFLSLFRSLQSDVTFTSCVPVTWGGPSLRPAVKTGAVVTNFSYRVLGANPKMEMKLTPEVQIIIEDGRDFSEMLEGIATEVTEILNAPEIVSAVT